MWALCLFGAIMAFGLVYAVIGGICQTVGELFKPQELWPKMPEAEEKKEPYMPYITVGQHYQPPQPVVPNTDPWVTYAMQHPEVKLEMVEKCKVEGDQFVAEKHVKMTGPLPGVVPTPQVPFWRSGFSLGGDQPRFMPAKNKTYSKLLENYNDLR